MKKIIFKIGISAVFFIVGLFLYCLTLSLNELNISILLPILLLAQLILSILYSASNYKRKYIIIAVALIIFHGFVVARNFSYCGKIIPKIGVISECDCVGVQKTSILSITKQCVGIRKKCFIYRNKEKKEVSCDQMKKMDDAYFDSSF